MNNKYNKENRIKAVIANKDAYNLYPDSDFIYYIFDDFQKQFVTNGYTNSLRFNGDLDFSVNNDLYNVEDILRRFHNSVEYITDLKKPFIPSAFDLNNLKIILIINNKEFKYNFIKNRFII